MLSQQKMADSNTEENSVNSALLELKYLYREMAEKHQAEQAAPRFTEEAAHKYQLTCEVKLKLTNKLNEFCQYIRLQKSDVPSVKKALLNHATGTENISIDPEWDISRDILLICQQFKIADGITSLILWLHKNKLANLTNYKKLAELTEISPELELLTQIYFYSVYNNEKDNSKEILAIKQKFFDEIITSSPRKKEIRTFDDVKIPEVNFVEKKFRIPKENLEKVKHLYANIKEHDLGRIDEIATNTALFNAISQTESNNIVGAEDLFVNDTNITSTITLGMEQLYLLLRIIGCAATPSPCGKRYYFEEISSEDYVEHKPTAEEKQRQAHDEELINSALQLMDDMFGKVKAEALLNLWRCGLSFAKAFSLEWVSRFFSSPKNYETDFLLAARDLWHTQKFKSESTARWEPSIDDLDYVMEYLKSHAVPRDEILEAKSASNSKSNCLSNIFYYHDVRNTDNKFPVLNLVAGLRWLRNHGLYNDENKKALYYLVDQLIFLDSVGFGYKNPPTDFKQRIFDIIISHISPQLSLSTQNRHSLFASQAIIDAAVRPIVKLRATSRQMYNI